MADFSQIEQNYKNNRHNKAIREAYKVVLISRIDKDRSDLCQAYSGFKSNLSPGKIWQNLIPADGNNSALMNKLMDIVKGYPYISLYAGKSLLKLGKIGVKSKLLRVFAIIAVAKLISLKIQKPQSEDDQVSETASY